MADTGYLRNLISFAFYHKLLAQLTLRKTNGITIVAGNRQNIALVYLRIFVVLLKEMWLFYDFGVVDKLPLNVVIGGLIMRFHNAQLKYSNSS